MSWTTTLARAATAGRVRRPLIDTRKFSPATARTLRSGGRSTLDPSSGRSCSAVTSAFPLVRSPAHPRSRSLAPVHTHPFFRTLSVDGPVSFVLLTRSPLRGRNARIARARDVIDLPFRAARASHSFVAEKRSRFVSPFAQTRDNGGSSAESSECSRASDGVGGWCAFAILSPGDSRSIVSRTKAYRWAILTCLWWSALITVSPGARIFAGKKTGKFGG